MPVPFDILEFNCIRLPIFFTFRFGNLLKHLMCEINYDDNDLHPLLFTGLEKLPCKGCFTRSDFWIRFLLKFKEVTDVNQYFYELKQCQKKNGSENRIV